MLLLVIIKYENFYGYIFTNQTEGFLDIDYSQRFSDTESKKEKNNNAVFRLA